MSDWFAAAEFVISPTDFPFSRLKSDCNKTSQPVNVCPVALKAQKQIINKLLLRNLLPVTTFIEIHQVRYSGMDPNLLFRHPQV